MNAVHHEGPQPAGTTIPDPTWHTLYRIGGLAAFLTALTYLVAMVIELTVTSAPESGGAAMLAYIADHRALYILQQILWLGPSVLLVVVFLALYPTLKGLDPSLTAIAVVLGITSWAVTLAYPATGGGAPALVYLSDQYAAAATEGQRAIFAAAAESFIAMNSVSTLMGVLETFAILLVGLVMLKGIFPRWLAALSIATGSIGMVSEALKPIFGVGFAVYGLLVLVWIVAIGWELRGLGRSARPVLRQHALGRPV